MKKGGEYKPPILHVFLWMGDSIFVKKNVEKVFW